MSAQDGGPAFPVEAREWYDYQLMKTMRSPPTIGMTMRDYFAAKAMHGYVASDRSNPRFCGDTARISYEMADAMIAARSAK